MSGLWRNLLVMGYVGARALTRRQQQAQGHDQSTGTPQARGEVSSNAPWWYKMARGGSATGSNGWLARTPDRAAAGASRSEWRSAWNKAPVENRDLHNLPPIDDAPVQNTPAAQHDVSVEEPSAVTVTPVRDQGKVEARPLSSTAEPVAYDYDTPSVSDAAKIAASVAIGNAQASSAAQTAPVVTRSLAPEPARTTSVAAAVTEHPSGVIETRGQLSDKFSVETYRRALDQVKQGTALRTLAGLDAPQSSPTQQQAYAQPELAPG